MRTFAIRVKELRKELGMTKEELAKAIGVSTKTISAWESGKRQTTLSKLARLMQFFNVRGNYLLGLDDVKHTKL